MKYLDHLEEWFITFLIGAATLVVFAAVLHRYAAGITVVPGVQDWALSIRMTWAQELTIIMFVWMAKFGAAYGVRQGIHVGVDVLVNRLSAPVRSKFIVISLLSGALFTGMVAALGAYFVWENGAHYFFFHLLNIPLLDVPEGPRTGDLEWPTWMVYSAIPLGTSLMCMRFLQVLVTFLNTGTVPHHDHGHVDGLPESDLSSTPEVLKK